MAYIRLFYELIQVALGTRDELSQIPSNQEWEAIFAMSKKQAATGVAFLSLDKLSRNGTKPPIQLLYEWIGLSEQIKAQNDLLEKRILEVTNLFENAGFQSCILKGQGNARMYPVPTSRIPGDIDLWVFAKRNEINQFVRERCPEAFEQYHHIDFPIFKDVEVEVHYTPGQLLSPKYDKRFQDWCNKQISNITLGNSLYGFKIPSIGFNAVFQMVHMMVHFFIEGIGLRHFIDFYYVLVSLPEDNVEATIDTIRLLGLERFAKGVMWIEKECLGADRSILLWEPNKKIGKVILREMEEGGNFGHHDKRYSIREKGLFARGLADSYRLIKLSTVFPRESTWKLIDKIKSQRWKLNQIKKYR